MTGFILILIAVISLAASAFDTEIGSPDARLAVGFAVYLTLSFVVVFFLNLTTTSGLFSSGAMRLPSTLPLTRVEVEQLNYLTFVRIFIGPVALSLIVFPAGCLLLFGPLVALVSLIACASTVSIAIGALIRVAKWFHKKTHQTDESRLSSIVRVTASIGIVIGMISVYSLGSYRPDLMRFIISLSVEAGSGVFTILALIFPFSFGFMAASAAFGPLIPLSTILAAIAGTAFYSFIAVLSFRSSGQTLRAVTLGGISTSKPGLLKEVVVDIVSPLRSMIRKDLKLATRNIGSAFIFAIPIFLIVMLFPMLQYWRGPNGFLRSISALTAIEYANLFGGISLVSILMFDTQGASVHEGLPVSSRLILKTKTVIMIVPYLFCMLALDIVVLLNSPITPLVLLIPVVQMPMGYVIGMAVGGAVFRIRGGGRAVAVNVTSDQAMGFVSAFVGALVGIVPLVGYGLMMLFTGSQIISLAAQGLIVLVMVVASWRFIPKLLKD
jgi:predicted permease